MTKWIRKPVLVWDFDNTLAYRDGMWGTSVYEVLVTNGYKHFSKESIMALLTTRFPWHRHEEAHSDYFTDQDWWGYVNGIIAEALVSLGFETDEALSLASKTKEEYLNISRWHLYEDTRVTLQRSVDSGFKNYILSNHVPELSQIVIGLGIHNYFEGIFTSGTIGHEKPNIEIFRVLRKQVGQNEMIYMIGDSYEADVYGALNAGLNAILVRNKNTFDYSNYSQDLTHIWRFVL